MKLTFMESQVENVLNDIGIVVVFQCHVDEDPCSGEVRFLPDKSSLERCLSRERAYKELAIMMMRLLVMMFMMFVKNW